MTGSEMKGNNHDEDSYEDIYSFTIINDFHSQKQLICLLNKVKKIQYIFQIHLCMTDFFIFF